MSSLPKILVVQVAGLGRDFLEAHAPNLQFARSTWRPLQPVFPAVTCSVQATMRTGSYPAQHGVVGNGYYSRAQHQVYFWEQSSSLIQGPRIWDDYRAAGGQVGVMFHQQSLGTDADLLLSPAPIHLHEGGMVQDCFSRPSELYPELVQRQGGFNLFYYWGPLTSPKSTEWIVTATEAVLRRHDAPGLLFTYLPHLDYDLQKHGPRSDQAVTALARVEGWLERLALTAQETGYRVLFYGDYAISEVHHAIYPNRLLRQAEWLRTRNVKGRHYLDMHTSPALAVVDHQIAHVVCPDPRTRRQVQALFGAVPGIAAVLDEDGQQQMQVRHERSGDLILVAAPGYWFAYPWWEDPKEAPDYATHVDIHNKPGYDPGELYFETRSLLSFAVSQDPRLIRGSHGIVGPGTDTLYTTDLQLDGDCTTQVDLSQALARYLKAASHP